MIHPVSEAPVLGEFERHARHYDESARVQRWSADRLAELISTLANLAPPGELVELAAGTGLMTSHLLRIFPDRTVYASDMSPAMVNVLSGKLESEFSSRLVTEVLDATSADIVSNSTAAVVCAFSLQWFQDPVSTVHNWMEDLPKGALCFLSWPGRDSFPQWKQMCEQANVQYTGNPLPGGDLVDQIAAATSVELLYHARESVNLHFADATEFFRSIRDVGAGAELSTVDGRRNLLKVVRLWDRQSPVGVEVTHRVHFAAFRKR